MKRHFPIGFLALLLTACAAPSPCDSTRLNCNNGTRATGGAVARPASPGIGNNPGGVTGGGQVGNPGTGPGKGDGAGPGKGPGKGHGDAGTKGGGKGHVGHKGHGGQGGQGKGHGKGGKS